jgi:hypothetical protein
MGEPRELFETELAESEKNFFGFGVHPRESPQQSAAVQKELLEDWQ